MAAVNSSSSRPAFAVGRMTLGAPAAVPAELRGGFAVLGNLDGVHRGHQGLIEAARQRAAALSAPAIAITFEPHPRALFRPEEPLFRLTPEPAKLRLLKAAGLDGAVVLTFDRLLAALEPENFVAEILGDSLALRGLVIGEDFRFGRGRRGDAGLLRDIGGLEVVILAPILGPAGEPFSSGRVRTALAAGDVAAANAILGYRWFVTGTVTGGDRRGRLLGYPTANLPAPAGFGLRHGIYAVTLTRPDGLPLPAVASFGRRPTFDNGAPILEVHVFDFGGDLYGESVTVTFHGWIRPELRFDSAEALITQMDEDSADARQILAASGPGTVLDQALREAAEGGHSVAGPVSMA